MKRATQQRIRSAAFHLTTPMAAAILLSALTVSPARAQSFQIVHYFAGLADGGNPNAGLTRYSGDTFYGGSYSSVYRLADQGSGWTVVPTAELPGGNDGLLVNGRLTVGPDSALYGATAFGGFSDCDDGLGCGVIFKLTPPATFCRSVLCYWNETVLYSFNPDGTPDAGYLPTGGLVFDRAGNIYGTANAGGQYGKGTVFELTPSQAGWTVRILYSFMGSTDGAAPNGSLLIDASGNLYGTAEEGGDLSCIRGDGCGVVFELTHTSGWVENVLHTFERTDGLLPYGGLIADSAGNLYGGTSGGGANQGGTIYELTLSNGTWLFNLLYALPGPSESGAVGLLAMDNSGNLYGATNAAGNHSYGNVFELSFANGTWNYQDLHDFEGPDGMFPDDGPTYDANGNLLGTTSYGGDNNCDDGCGVIWEITP
jgi:uncharacterized repeat protein (TIGR03803 family)